MDTRVLQEQMVGRILSDPRFRQALLDDPEKCMTEHGYPPNAELVRAITSTDRSVIESMAAQFEQGQKLYGSSI